MTLIQFTAATFFALLGAKGSLATPLGTSRRLGESASFPVERDLLATIWQQLGTDLLPEATGDAFGLYVDISTDGTTIAVAAPGNDANGNLAGQVKVFRYNQGWSQMGQSLNGELPGWRFGDKVSLNGDGTVVASAYAETRGVVRISQYNATADSWYQLGSRVEAGGSGTQLGTSNIYDLSHDGHTIVIGNYNNPNGGFAKVLSFDGTDWVQVGNLITGSGSEKLGIDVKISGNGLTVATASFNGQPDNSGLVRVFTFDGSDWQLIGDAINGPSGGVSVRSVAMSDAGDVVAFAAPYADADGLTNNGIVRKLRLVSGSWQQEGPDLAGTFNDQRIGTPLGMSSDGSTVSFAQSCYGEHGCRVSVFRLETGQWFPRGSVVVQNMEFAQALSGDGTRLIGGASAYPGGGLARVWDALEVPSAAPTKAPVANPMTTAYPTLSTSTITITMEEVDGGIQLTETGTLTDLSGLTVKGEFASISIGKMATSFFQQYLGIFGQSPTYTWYHYDSCGSSVFCWDAVDSSGCPTVDIFLDYIDDPTDPIDIALFFYPKVISHVYIGSDFVPGEELSGSALIPGASFSQLGIAAGAPCYVQWSDGSGTGQRIELVSIAAPTTPPTGSPTTSIAPSTQPSAAPSTEPSLTPTETPTGTPSAEPTTSMIPSSTPSLMPSVVPSGAPSLMPSVSMMPSLRPSTRPSSSLEPSTEPSNMPTKVPTDIPTMEPTPPPTPSPTLPPTEFPSTAPTKVPTANPTTTPYPTFLTSAITITMEEVEGGLQITMTGTLTNLSGLTERSTLAHTQGDKIGTGSSANSSFQQFLAISGQSPTITWFAYDWCGSSGLCWDAVDNSGCPTVNTVFDYLDDPFDPIDMALVFYPQLESSFFIGSDFVPGDELSGSAFIPDASFSQLGIATGAPCYVQWSDDRGAGQRIELVSIAAPTNSPTTSILPSTQPSTMPSLRPSPRPSNSLEPSKAPSNMPTKTGTDTPTMEPTPPPTASPTLPPTPNPTDGPTYSPVPQWSQLPGAANDVGAGSSTSVVGLDYYGSGGFGVYLLDEPPTGWVQIPGAAVKVDVAHNTGRLVVANGIGNLFDWSGNAWTHLPGPYASDVGLSSNGRLCITGAPDPALLGDGYIFCENLSLGGFEQLPGSAIHIAVKSDGNPVVVNAGGTLYSWNGGWWDVYQGQFVDVAVGPGDELWAVSSSNQVVQVVSPSFTDPLASAPPAKRISVDSDGHLWITAAETGWIYQFN